MDVGHLSRMNEKKLKYVYLFTYQRSNTEWFINSKTQMLLRLTKDYPNYCRTIKTAIKSSYKYKDEYDPSHNTS